MIVITGGREKDTLLKQLKGMQKHFRFEMEVMQEDETAEQEVDQEDDEASKAPKAPKGRKKTK